MLTLLKYILTKKSQTEEVDIFEDAETGDDVPLNIAKNDLPTPIKHIEFQVPKQIQHDIKKLRNDAPEYFEPVGRNILGNVVEANSTNLVVESDRYERVNVDLDSVEKDYTHEIGDRVYVMCHVQTEELFSGELKETFELVAVKPAAKRRNQRCIVTEISSDLVVLNKDCFISEPVLKQFGESKLKIGDKLEANLIECKKAIFKWRCTSFAYIKSNIDLISDLKLEPKCKKKHLTPPVLGENWRTYQTGLYEYASQVWAHQVLTIVPGEGVTVRRRFKAVHIPHFHVPEKLSAIYLKQYSKPLIGRRELEAAFPLLKEDLCFENYIQRFQTLLWLDELDLFKNFRTYDSECTHFTRDSEFLMLTIENLAERRPSLAIGDKIRAFPLRKASPITNNDVNRNSNDGMCFEGCVHNVLGDRVMLKFNTNFQETYNGERFRTEFYFSRKNYRKRHYALHRAVRNLGEDFFFSTKLKLRSEPQLDISFDMKTQNMQSTDNVIKWYDANLNGIQRQAVFNILRGQTENLPYVIFGPPGTGKTITIVETILQLVSNVPDSRLLIATPSNSAANLICNRLIESQGLHMGEMVRLVSHNLIERDQIPDNLLRYCATPELGRDGTCQTEMFTTQDGILRNCSLRNLARYRVTIGTCHTLGKYLELGFNDDHFTHVLVDEAAQCTEPDIMIAISQVSKRRGQVILAGDPKQLPPIVISNYAIDCGLSTSFVERLLSKPPYMKDKLKFPATSGFNPLLVTQLLLNYRSLPSILNIYNGLSYNSELRATINENDSREIKILQHIEKKALSSCPNRSHAHAAFFYAVRGQNKRDKSSPSWYNSREAVAVFHMVLMLYQQGLQPENIGIIAPYNKQGKYIRNLFIEVKLKYPKIGSVEEFQGQERDVIILSTVRTTRSEVFKYDCKYSLGFMKSKRRVNVALSRARALLVVFGDPNLLSAEHYWDVYIQNCQQEGSYFGSQ